MCSGANPWEQRPLWRCARQVDALRAAGCERVRTDVASGPRARRAALDQLVAAAAAGDNVVVRRLDRLGRSLPHLLGLVEDLAAAGVGLRSLSEEIDASSATGRLVLHVFGALAELERGINHELIYTQRSVLSDVELRHAC